MVPVPAHTTPPTELQKSRQCLLVLADGWHSQAGELYRLERKGTEEKWSRSGEPWPVTLGRAGLAPSPTALLGLSAPAGLQKREGDDRSPAGIFRLGRAFGFTTAATRVTRLPYFQITPGTQAVDDPASRFYNQIVDTATTPVAWRHAEKMHAIAEYRVGLVVEYNTRAPQPGAGSCIFLHCWVGPGVLTSGCTAMAEKNLRAVLQWLDPAADPLLLQIPRATYEKIRTDWALPLILP